MAIYKREKNWYIDFTFKGQRVRESIGPSRKGAEKVISKKKAGPHTKFYSLLTKKQGPNYRCLAPRSFDGLWSNGFVS
jgi:hypothetical protein